MDETGQENGREKVGGKWPGATLETAIRVEAPFLHKTDVWRLEGKDGGEILVDGDFVVYTNRKLHEQRERRKFRILEEVEGGKKRLTPNARSVLIKPQLKIYNREGKNHLSWGPGYLFGDGATESDSKKVTRKKGGTTFTRWEIETKPRLEIDGQDLFALHQKILECVETQSALGLVSQEDCEKVREFVEEEMKWKETTEERSKAVKVVKVVKKERPLSLRERLERQIEASSEPIVRLSLPAGDLREFIRSIPLPQGAEWSRIELSFKNGRLLFSGRASKLIFGVDFEAEFWVDPKKGIQAKLIDISDQGRRQAVEENLQRLDTHLRSYFKKNFPEITLEGIEIGKNNVFVEVKKQ